MKASQKGQIKIVRELIKKKEDLNIRDNSKIRRKKDIQH